MTGFSKRLGLLFLVALVGVLAMIGAVLGRELGGPVALGYALVVIALLATGSVLARRQERAAADARLAAGRTCTCCTGTVHDPVQVL